MNKMKSRLYGLIGVKSIMSNWNADFTGRPKSISDGSIFGSDKALKYSMKRLWENQNEKVLFIKSFKIDEKGKKEEKNKLQPKELKERYEEIFGAKLDKGVPSKEVLKNLFSAIDVMNFGATFAIEKQNISITGAVQIGQGFNKFEDSMVEIQDILSPFSNSKNKDAVQGSIGKKIVSNEAHYIYPFSVNPKNYKEYEKVIEGFEGYTKDAYEKFKDAALIGATALNTNSKCGCENEFALFIECKEDSELYLSNLDQYVTFEKEEKNLINLENLSNLINNENIINNIKNIELYYNPMLVELKHDFSKELTKKFHIITKEAL